ncbi:PepSY-associated TM helix domain-containing protein [Methylomonas albis]|uniref:PepSY domain-containing protein n=1 Tax=Methylomonas albis TaxID=1854563 RepID=A0ABR9D525_9GAMM|nr:PepSY-associated TM helix domain-containing protein [Methylomonas albis]MBD9357881.1 PepSY domain-containing protein [Methylomonas albis]
MRATASKRQARRQFWLAVHLYLGLSLGLIIAMVGLSGSLLVFYIDLDEWLNPQLIISESTTQRQSYEDIFQALRRTEPTRQRGWRLEIPEDPQRAITARYYKPGETAHHGFAPLTLSVDPFTGTVLANRFWGEFAMTWLYDLHYKLLLDDLGKILMAILGGLLLISLVSGVYLWWPPLHKLKSALSLKRNASRERLNYDLHKLAGVYSLIVIMVLAVTGIALEIPQYVNPILGYFSPLQASPAPKSAITQNNPARISLDQAVAVGQARFPQARLCWIETPHDANGSYRINLRQTGEPSQRFPKTNVWVDQYSGQVLAVSNPDELGSSDTIINWLHPLHTGEAFGLTGQLLVLISGLLCPLLFITGVIRWLQKRRGRPMRHRQQRHTAKNQPLSPELLNR